MEWYLSACMLCCIRYVTRVNLHRFDSADVVVVLMYDAIVIAMLLLVPALSGKKLDGLYLRVCSCPSSPIEAYTSSFHVMRQVNAYTISSACGH